jgi:hypothetical protein
MSNVALKQAEPDTLKSDTLKTKGDFSGFKIAKSEDGIETLIDLDPAQTASVYFAMKRYLFPDTAS